MKFVSTFSVRRGCWQEAATRFIAGKGQPVIEDTEAGPALAQRYGQAK